MTRDQFIRRWENHTAGVIAQGHAKMKKLANGEFMTHALAGEVLMGLTDTTRGLLGQLFDSIAPSPAPEQQKGKPP